MPGICLSNADVAKLSLPQAIISARLAGIAKNFRPAPLVQAATPEAICCCGPGLGKTLLQPTCLSSLLGHSHNQLEIVEESLAFGFGATER